MAKNLSHEGSTPEKSCPNCGSSAKILIQSNQLLWGQRYSVYKCDGCGLGFTWPHPSIRLLETIYSGDYWIREKATKTQGVMGRLIEAFNQMRLTETIRPLIRRLSPGDAILEVGCGSGQLARWLKAQGFDIEVTDVNPDLLNEIQRCYGIKGYCGDMETIRFPKKYNAIIFNNVLEHLARPKAVMEKAATLLAPHGLMFVESPNIEGLQFRLFRGKWYHLDLPKHLYHFSPRSLTALSSESGLGLIWQSTFSPRISAAGYVASLVPALRPEKIRLSWSKISLGIYLGLQMLFLPVAMAEAFAGQGTVIRGVFQKRADAEPASGNMGNAESLPVIGHKVLRKQ